MLWALVNPAHLLVLLSNGLAYHRQNTFNRKYYCNKHHYLNMPCNCSQDSCPQDNSPKYNKNLYLDPFAIIDFYFSSNYISFFLLIRRKS